MKEVRVILSPEAEEVYKRLNAEAENSKQARMILKAINNKKELIKANIHYGEPIAKNLIPEEYKQRCEENIQKIIDSLEIKEMKFREFNDIIKNTTFCRFDKRDFSNNCPICKRFGISRRL